MEGTAIPLYDEPTDLCASSALATGAVPGGSGEPFTAYRAARFERWLCRKYTNATSARAGR